MPAIVAVQAELSNRMRESLGAGVLATLSGLLYAQGFPPALSPLLGWAALVPLLLALTFVSPGRAFLVGAWWCVVACIGVAGFLVEMVADFFALPEAFGLVAFGGVTALIAPFYGAYAAWVSWLLRRGGASALLVAAGWGVCEYARSAFSHGGGWALLGYSQASLERVIQTVDLAGPYGLGMLMAGVAFVLAGFLSPVLRGPRFPVAVLGAAVLVAGAVGYGEWRLSQSFADGPAVRVALVQAGLERSVRRDPGRREANLRRHLELTGRAAHDAPSLIFWPEYAVDFYLREASPERARVFETALASGADLILGGPHYRVRSDPPRYHSSVFLIRDGRFGGRYDKTAPLPFAESNPLQALLPRSVHYSPGERPRPLETSALPVGVFLCSEALDPALPRRLSRAGAELLANPANDDWFGAESAARLHLDTARVRAIENRRFVVRTTPTGYSAIIDPHGRVTALGGLGGSEVVHGDVRSSRVRTPYQRVGESFVGLAIMVAVAGTAKSLRSEQRSNGGAS